jgi:putative hydrolase of the HAD superfamily
LERLSKLNLDTPSWDVDELVEETYQVWENERHFAAERYLYPDAISMLETVKQSFPDACIAAVTNGKGNPLCMGTLKQYFEFCVSGEDDDIFPRRKPDSGIYEVTKEKYRARYQHHNAESHLWCHVGDCLINDVGASAACGAFAVWYAPMLENVAGGKTQPNYSTLSHSEWQQRERQANADREKVAARITSLPELMGAISEFVSGSK